MIPLEVLGVQADPSQGTPVVLLQETDEPHRVLPIFIGATEAASIALGLTGTPLPRPLTHDLLVDVLAHTSAHLDRVEVTEVRDGVFVAELAVTGPGGTSRLSSRPSDAIALAVRLGTPLFAAEDVLDEAGAVLVLEGDEDTDDAAPDEETIESEVAGFRHFLAGLRPEDFTAPDETDETDETGQSGDPGDETA
jgi:uncharacterized protein